MSYQHSHQIPTLLPWEAQFSLGTSPASPFLSLPFSFPHSRKGKLEAMLLKLSPESPGNLVQIQIPSPTPRVSNPVGLGWCYISNRLHFLDVPGDADATGLWELLTYNVWQVNRVHSPATSHLPKKVQAPVACKGGRQVLLEGTTQIEVNVCYSRCTESICWWFAWLFSECHKKFSWYSLSPDQILL